MNDLYDIEVNAREFKRVKITESENKGNDFTECGTTVYDQDDLHQFVENEAKIVIHSNTDNITKVESNLPKKGEEEVFFRQITQQLESL